MKFSLNEVVEAMKEAKVSPDIIDTTLIKLSELEDELKKAKDPTSRVKKKFVIVASNGDLSVSEVPMWIVQIDEDEDHTQIIDNIRKATNTYKNNPKKKGVQINTIGEAIQEVSKKDFSMYGVSLKTKDPVIVVETDNKLN